METVSSNDPQKRPASLLDEKILSQGQAIFKAMESDSKSIFNKDWWYGRIMDWSMKNEHFKTQMFRFVDVLPYLNSHAEVARHLKEYFNDNGGEELPSIFNFGLGLGSLAPGFLANSVKKNVEQMAKMFITGESPQAAIPLLKKARKNKICFTADLLGEATLSEEEALEYQRRYLDLIQELAKDSQTWESVELIDQDESGPLPKVNVSVKVTALYSQINEAAWEQSLAICKERLRPILSIAKQNNVFINLDMEQYAHKDFILKLFTDLISEPEFRDWKNVGIVIQAYLRDSKEDVLKLGAFAKKRGVPFTVRLVKGAYWDYELISAKQNGWPIPVYTNKKESDANYEDCMNSLLDFYPHVKLAIGSHNVRSIAAGLVAAKERNIPGAAIEVQMLFGMAEPIKRALVQLNYRVREYATIGELIPGMAYLVRRLLENTSNESFLRSKFAENVSVEKLMENPNVNLVPSAAEPVLDELFYNEPPLDFAQEKVRKRFQEALQNMEKKLAKLEIQPQINRQSLKTDSIFERENPSHPSQRVLRAHMAGVKEAELAVQTAKKSWTSWNRTPAEERAQIIERVGSLLIQERYELAALEVFEVGKPWGEADADVTEAIDFCHYYAKEMRRLKPFRTGRAPGEHSLYQYQGRGVAVVISPWNFPLAILTGMVTAALVTGNSVIMKPAEQSMAVASELYRILLKAGVPPEVVSFLPGRGEEVGAYLVNHPQVDMIAFTGSKPVGLNILQQAALVHPGQRQIKKCILELGGKNAIIIDSDADLDEAVEGVIYSAFGFSGQKCSACSRVIVLESIYDRFLSRLIAAVKSLPIGFAEDPNSYMGPVVDEEAYTRLKTVVEKSSQNVNESGQLIYQAEVPREGYFIPPTIFAHVPPQSNLAQDEFFGPLLAVIKAKDLEEAISIANNTIYALTGGLYSRSPSNINKVKETFEVGNLYINRGNTGALVERHPFGGYKMSGVGSKAGGPDYLLQFMEPRVVTENTLRRGFAPDLN